MAAIPATITVNFISNYAGPHRVCWRIGPSGAYNCTTVVNCAGGGNPCQAIINTTVDNDTCPQLNFNGYTQAACEAESSPNGRDPFSVTFTPNPTCKSYHLACSSVGVNTINITNPGSGYNPLSPPAVTITGTGIGATATSVVGNGGIVNTVSINGGAGYVSGTYTAVPAVNIVGTGVGATFNVVVVTGVVTAITVNNPGSGYNIGDTFEFNNANLGGSGAGVVYEVLTLNTGQVQQITVTLPGSGFSTVATVTIDPPPGPGTTATVNAVMQNCGTFNVATSCGGGPSASIADFELGQSINVCTPTNIVELSPSQGYVITQSGCCFECVYITATKGALDGNGTLYYTNCTTRQLTQVALTTGSQSFCVVNNSWAVVEDLPGNSTSITIATTCP